MRRTDPKHFARGGRIVRSQAGYDGQRHFPDRRVSVNPDAMWGSAYACSLEAKGILLDVFYRFWSQDRLPSAEVVRRSHRPVSKRRFERLVGELVEEGLLAKRGDHLLPIGPFGPDPAAAAVTRISRDMPSDWLEIREAVFERDGYGCVYCGSGRDLHCDHVEPVALGGGHGMDNLVTACAACNLSKGSKTLAQWRPEIAARLKR